MVFLLQILYAKDTDQRSTTFEKSFTMGQEYQRRTKALILRAAVLKNQINVKVCYTVYILISAHTPLSVLRCFSYCQSTQGCNSGFPQALEIMENHEKKCQNNWECRRNEQSVNDYFLFFQASKIWCPL